MTTPGQTLAAALVILAALFGYALGTRTTHRDPVRYFHHGGNLYAHTGDLLAFWHLPSQSWHFFPAPIPTPPHEDRAPWTTPADPLGDPAAPAN